MQNAICNSDGCVKNAKARGLCATCYWKARKSGTLDLLPRPTIEDRFWPKVDKSGECWLWTGNYTRDSHYGTIYYQGRSQPAHRVAWMLAGNGDIPDKHEIDHICHVRLCVRPDHLRVVTRKQNVENHQGALRTNKVGIRGVSKNGTRWRAEMRHNGRRIHIGYFDTPEEAGEAVRKKRIELFTHNDLDRTG